MNENLAQVQLTYVDLPDFADTKERELKRLDAPAGGYPAAIMAPSGELDDEVGTPQDAAISARAPSTLQSWEPSTTRRRSLPQAA